MTQQITIYPKVPETLQEPKPLLQRKPAPTEKRWQTKQTPRSRGYATPPGGVHIELLKHQRGLPK